MGLLSIASILPSAGNPFKGASSNAEIATDHLPIRHELGRRNRKPVQMSKEKVSKIEPGIG